MLNWSYVLICERSAQSCQRIIRTCRENNAVSELKDKKEYGFMHSVTVCVKPILRDPGTVSQHGMKLESQALTLSNSKSWKITQEFK